MEEPELKTVTDYNGYKIQYNPNYVVMIKYNIWRIGPLEGKKYKTIHMISGKEIIINDKNNE